MPNARPILMHARSIRNLLAGTKSQTRRIVKPQPSAAPHLLSIDGRLSAMWGDPRTRGNQVCPCPYGQPGDLLYVKETFCCGTPAHPSGIGIIPSAKIKRGQKVVYRAATDFAGDDPPWRPSIHMPRSFSRLTLELTDVRVERVQDISVDDCHAEGIPYRSSDEPASGSAKNAYDNARNAFYHLWNDTNGAGAWERNDWCWALTFRVHRGNVDQFLHLARGGVIKAGQPYVVGERPAEETSPPWPRP